MIVIDASVVFAATIRDGTTREALLTCDAPLVAPPAIWGEIQAHTPRIVNLANASEEQVRAFLHAVSLKVRTVPVSRFAHMRQAARHACEQAQAWDDDEYVALAMALQAPIWTLDSDFQRIAGIEVVVGRDVVED